MQAVDTNVLVRLLAQDDLQQAQAADQFVAKGAWVSQLVLAETLSVLDGVYQKFRISSNNPTFPKTCWIDRTDPLTSRFTNTSPSRGTMPN